MSARIKVHLNELYGLAEKFFGLKMGVDEVWKELCEMGYVKPPETIDVS